MFFHIMSLGAPGGELLPALPAFSHVWSFVDFLVTGITSLNSQRAATGTTSDWERDASSEFPLNFEQSLASELYLYTAAAYCSKAALGSMQCGSLCEDLAPNTVDASDVVILAAPHTETQTLIAVDHINDLIIIATRGTTPWDLSYWIIDTGAFPQRVPDYCRTCFVHSAFYAAYSAVKTEAYKTLETLLAAAVTSGKPKVSAVVGHSAGGATAYLTAFDVGIGIHTSVKQVRYLITYGAPRVGNVAFVDALHKGVGLDHGYSEGWRCVYGGDPIPFTVPYFLGYVHPIAEVHLYADDVGYKVCGAPDTSAFLVKEDPSCSTLYMQVNIDHHTEYFGKFLLNEALSCGLLNEENAYYNSTIDLALKQSFERSATSWMPF